MSCTGERDARVDNFNKDFGMYVRCVCDTNFKDTSVIVIDKPKENELPIKANKYYNLIITVNADCDLYINSKLVGFFMLDGETTRSSDYKLKNGKYNLIVKDYTGRTRKKEILLEKNNTTVNFKF
jgi:hypothetical protein